MKKTVKHICALLSVLMAAVIFASMPVTASAAQADDLAAKVGADAGEAVGATVKSNLQIIRDYIGNNCDFTDDEGKNVVFSLTDENNKKINVYLTLHDSGSFSFYMYYYLSSDLVAAASIQQFDFRSSLNLTPQVMLYLAEGVTHFSGSMSVNAATYDPETEYPAEITNRSGEYSDNTARYSVRYYTATSFTVYNYVLNKHMGIQLGDIGFVNYPNSLPVDAEKISLNTTVLTLTKGNTYKLYATISPTNTTDKSLTWSTSNSAVATVSKGTVTAKAGGTATITAKTASGVTAKCQVTVNAPATAIKLNLSSVTITAGTSYKIYATIEPSDATDKTVYWSSSNTTVAGMASGGVINAKTAGTATITASTKNGKTATCKVTVAPVAKSIKLNLSSVTMTAGTTYKLYATISPSNVIDKTVYWSSGNTSVAGMGAGGVINAKAPGTATITAKTKNGKSTTCKVTVKASKGAPTGIKLNYSALTMTAGTKFTLKATISPSNAKNKTVYWSSGDTSVATVASGGVITAKKAGSCTITAKTTNGIKATCKITVKAKSGSAADSYITNFNKVRTYISNKGSVDGEGHKYISKVFNSSSVMTLTNLSDGYIQCTHIQKADVYSYQTTLKWNLAKSDNGQVTVKVYKNSSSSPALSASATFNVKTYSGSNASFSIGQSSLSNASNIAHGCLNDALGWLDEFTRYNVGVKVQDIGFIKYS